MGGGHDYNVGEIAGGRGGPGGRRGPKSGWLHKVRGTEQILSKCGTTWYQEAKSQSKELPVAIATSTGICDT